MKKPFAKCTEKILKYKSSFQSENEKKELEISTSNL